MELRIAHPADGTVIEAIDLRKEIDQAGQQFMLTPAEAFIFRSKARIRW
jgi:hypothetical protein